MNFNWLQNKMMLNVKVELISLLKSVKVQLTLLTLIIEVLFVFG